jgi:hypothetical protein
MMASDRWSMSRGELNDLIDEIAFSDKIEFDRDEE